MIKIFQNETLLAEINPTTKLLKDAINLIPDFGFINNPDERRTALSNKINAFETMFGANAMQGAVNKLKFDIKDKVSKWVLDEFIKHPWEFSKNDVLNLIDETIGRLESQFP